MKIAIPVDDSTMGSAVCVSFGRAPYFLLHDSALEQNDFIVNTAADAESGAGLKAAQLVADSAAEALLTVRCGQNSAEVLAAAEVEIYKTEYPNAKENLAAFLEGKLARMTNFHAGFHGLQ